MTQSGETREMIDCVHQAVKRNFPTIGVVNAVGSTVANMVSCGTYTFAGDEKAAPSTKSFTNEVICLALISLWFRQVKAKEHGIKLPPQADSLGEALQRMPITVGMAMRTQSACKKAAKKLASKEHCFVLGKGMSIFFHLFCITSSIFVLSHQLHNPIQDLENLLQWRVHSN